MSAPTAPFPYWLAATALAFWFLAIHVPQYFITNHEERGDLLLHLHIVCAGGIYVACVHNAWCTPHSQRYAGRFPRDTAAGATSHHHHLSRISHVWIGRIGMLLGVLGLVTGYYMVWIRPRLDSSARPVDSTFGIAISIGGGFQLWAQIMGWRAIRNYQKIKEQQQTVVEEHATPHQLARLDEQAKDALRKHVGYMIGLFCCACGIPAALRIANDSIVVLIVVMLALFRLAKAYRQAWFEKIK